MRERARMIVNEKTTDAPNPASPWQSPNEDVRIGDQIESVTTGVPKKSHGRADESAEHREAGLAWIHRLPRMREIIRGLVQEDVEETRTEKTRNKNPKRQIKNLIWIQSALLGTTRSNARGNKKAERDKCPPSLKRETKDGVGCGREIGNHITFKTFRAAR